MNKKSKGLILPCHEHHHPQKVAESGQARNKEENNRANGDDSMFDV